MSSEEEIKTVKGRKSSVFVFSFDQKFCAQCCDVSSVAVSSLGEDSEGDTEIVEPETPTHKR